MKPANCDIFCNVIDNFGDIGVCWRLARQLAHEHGVAVRLWVDDLSSLCKLAPDIDASREVQVCSEVEVRHWTDPFPEVEPAGLVIEAFACELPESYVAAMAQQEPKPVWINLEYLSAEDWTAGCHKMPSPHPHLPLTKYFFFPGFTPDTGGLLLEHDLLARRDGFLGDSDAVARFWHELGLAPPQPSERRISLFGYENPALPDLLRAWEQGSGPITCLVPEGRIAPQVANYFGAQAAAAGAAFTQGNLRVHILPFVEQERYDELLWACDLNFVRGEDSFVRAQWAGRPFVWQIYPQEDGVHLKKLHAFMDRYCADMPDSARQALQNFWLAWNGAGPITPQVWNDFINVYSALSDYCHIWRQRISGNRLTTKLPCCLT